MDVVTYYIWTRNGEDKPTSQDVSYSDTQAYQPTQANLSLLSKSSETSKCNAIKNLTIRRADYFENFKQLISLKRYVLFRIQLGLFTLENRPQTGQFSHNTTNRPTIDSLRIMFSTQEELRRTIPDGYYHLVSCEKRLKRLINESSKT